MSVAMRCHFTSTHFHLLRVLAGQTERSATREAICIWGARLCLWTAHPDPAQRHRAHASGIERSPWHFQTSGGEWEAGSSYPKAGHQKVLLDDAWLHDLLAPLSPVALSPRAGTPGAHAAAKPAASPRVDLVEALDVSHFTGREVEGTA